MVLDAKEVEEVVKSGEVLVDEKYLKEVLKATKSHPILGKDFKLRAGSSLLQFLEGSNETHRNESSFFLTRDDVLRDCNKTAFLGWKHKLESSAKKLTKNLSGRLFVGKESLVSQEKGFGIREWLDPKLLTRVRSLRHSVILVCNCESN